MILAFQVLFNLFALFVFADLRPRSSFGSKERGHPQTCVGPKVGPKNTCLLLFIKAYLEKDSVWLVCLSLGLL